jgi:uncharacterized protein (TIGR00266 family)
MQCGQKAEAHAKFCKQCGAPLRQTPVPDEARGFVAAPEGRPADARPLRIEVEHGPVFTVAIIHLEDGQAVRAEAGAMVSMDPGVHLEARSEGGIWGGLKRVAAQESFSQSTYTAKNGPGSVTVAPDLPGDIVLVEMQGEKLIVQGSSYLAGHPSLRLDTQFGGLKGLLSGEGLFFLTVEGQGQLLLSSFGAIEARTLQAGEKLVVDSGHIVAYDATVDVKARTASPSLLNTLRSGEGMVAEYTGPGRVFLQSRSLASFMRRLLPVVQKAQVAGLFR